MDIWSSIPEPVLQFCRQWKRELIRYGLAAAFFISALGTGRWAAAAVILPGIGVMYAFDRWGEPWRKRGEEMLKSKKS